VSTKGAPSVESPNQAAAHPERQRQTILVVDDDFDTREMLKWMLRTEGYLAIMAENGAIALRALEEIKPDLIVTDLMMPLVSGEQFIRALKGRPELAELPILVLTAFSGIFGSQAVAAGATEVFEKPKDLARLVRTINRLLGQAGP